MAFEGIFEAISRLPYYSQISSIIGEPFFKIFTFTFILFIFGMIMWEFYSTLGERDLFKIKIEPQAGKWKKIKEILFFIFKYTIAFPFYTFFWFIIFSIFLIFLAKSVNVQEIFLISIAMISFVRITAYYKEELAVFVAQVIPATFLVIFLTDPTFFSIDLILARWEEFLSSFPGVLYYLLFTICLEWLLRIFYLLKLAILKKIRENW